MVFLWFSVAVMFPWHPMTLCQETMTRFQLWAKGFTFRSTERMPFWLKSRNSWDTKSCGVMDVLHMYIYIYICTYIYIYVHTHTDKYKYIDTIWYNDHHHAIKNRIKIGDLCHQKTKIFDVWKGTSRTTRISLSSLLLPWYPCARSSQRSGWPTSSWGPQRRDVMGMVCLSWAFFLGLYGGLLRFSRIFVAIQLGFMWWNRNTIGDFTEWDFKMTHQELS